jgi:hypothetical protein
MAFLPATTLRRRIRRSRQTRMGLVGLVRAW